MISNRNEIKGQQRLKLSNVKPAYFFIKNVNGHIFYYPMLGQM